jgi:hypothetical protein
MHVRGLSSVRWDVLLRHRLLREAGGFQGAFRVKVDPHAHRPAIPKCPDVNDFALHDDHTAFAATTRLEKRHNVVAYLFEPLRLELKFVKGLRKGSDRISYPFASVASLSARLFERFSRFTVPLHRPAGVFDRYLSGWTIGPADAKTRGQTDIGHSSARRPIERAVLDLISENASPTVEKT